MSSKTNLNLTPSFGLCLTNNNPSKFCKLKITELWVTKNKEITYIRTINHLTKDNYYGKE